jgi:glycosyltransferase involved in cell wall biosynthesis
MTISVIMVAYNSSKTIARALTSIMNQSRLPYEVLLIDGKSEDETLRIAARFKNSIPLKVISESDEGIYNAMNKGLHLASGDVVGFLNTDDEYSDKDSLNRVYKAFKDNSDIEIFVSGVDYLNNDNKISRKWRLNGIKPFQSGWHPPHPGFYASRKLLLQLDGFNEHYAIASDFDLMLRAFEKVDSENVVVDKDKVVNMYLGGTSNASISNIIKGNREILNSFKTQEIRVTYLYTVKRIVKKCLSIWQSR